MMYFEKSGLFVAVIGSIALGLFALLLNKKRILIEYPFYIF